ncbi:MAG: hypothetical protein FD187_319 [bacterium]|nr:MAG: hypothetical protein FD142_1877 [bacterium]KAF0150473.1 MAG: hypothetical protein FD187_319 [bacterium]KAF0169023.1 MAG: hypothetical protein FD158_881 [bacterium]TXT32786.1 MAG: hypothetical protein FD131_50 [Rhodocyclaceae bacterium]
MTIAAATHTNGLFGVLPLFALLLAGAALLRWNRRSKASVEPQLDQLEHDLDLIKTQILLVTTDILPGCRVVKTIGYVESLSETEAASDREYRIAEKEALLGLAQKALGIGANSVVGVRKINAHYDQAGSQWRVSRVAYCGTAVVSAK